MDDYPLPSQLELPNRAPPAPLVATIYPSEEGVTERGAAAGRKGQGRAPNMLSAAVRIHLDPHKNIKVQCLLGLPPQNHPPTTQGAHTPF